MIHAMGFYEREVRFYAQLAAKSPLRTPRCYFSALDGEQGLSMLLLEDLAPARNGSWVAGCSVEEAEAVVRAIAPFHARWWRRQEIVDMSWLQLRGLSGVEQAQAIFLQAWEPFLGNIGTRATTEIRQLGDWLGRHVGRLGTYLY